MSPRVAMVAFCMLSACTPTSVVDAEKKKNVAWLEANGSPEAVAALGRLADDDQDAQSALAALAKATVGKATTDAGAGALDVELAVWGGVERNASWAITMTKRELADPNRKQDMASAMKHGDVQIAAFIPDLEAAMPNGCDACGGALASIDGPNVTSAIARRLADGETRKSMCIGISASDSSGGARDAFMRAPVSSRDADVCTVTAARIASRDDAALSWLAKTAEPGLVRNLGEMKCDRQVKLWSTLLTSRDHATFGALPRALEDSVRACPKDLDATLAGALGADVDSATLVLSALGSSNARDLKQTCAATPAASQRVTAVLARANARDFIARCR